MLTYPYKIPRRGQKFHREKKRRRAASLDIIIKYFILIFKAHPTYVWYIVVHLAGFGGQQSAPTRGHVLDHRKACENLRIYEKNMPNIRTMCDMITNTYVSKPRML